MALPRSTRTDRPNERAGGRTIFSQQFFPISHIRNFTISVASPAPLCSLFPTLLLAGHRMPIPARPNGKTLPPPERVSESSKRTTVGCSTTTRVHHPPPIGCIINFREIINISLAAIKDGSREEKKLYPTRILGRASRRTEVKSRRE